MLHACGCQRTTCGNAVCLLPPCGSWGSNQVFRLGRKCLYSVSHLRAGEKTQWGKCLPCKRGDPSLHLPHVSIAWGLLVSFSTLFEIFLVHSVMSNFQLEYIHFKATLESLILLKFWISLACCGTEKHHYWQTEVESQHACWPPLILQSCMGQVPSSLWARSRVLASHTITSSPAVGGVSSLLGRVTVINPAGLWYPHSRREEELLGMGRYLALPQYPDYTRDRLSLATDFRNFIIDMEGRDLTLC